MADLNNIISGLNNMNARASQDMQQEGVSDIDELHFNFDFSDEMLNEALQQADSGSAADIQELSSSAQSDSLKSSDDATALPGDNPAAPLPVPKPNAGFAMPNLSEKISELKPAGGFSTNKFGAGLPAPKSIDGLPLPKTAPGLPIPKTAAGLPMPKNAPGLPIPKPTAQPASPKPLTGLPIPKQTPDFPSPKSLDPFPSPKKISETSAENASVKFSEPMQLQGRSASDAPVHFDDMSFSPQNFEDVLADEVVPLEFPPSFDSPSHPSLGMENSGLRDVQKLRLENSQPPVLKLDRSAPTGAFNHSHDFDGDSGLPLADDPLGLLAPQPANKRDASASHDSANHAADNSSDILGLFNEPEFNSNPQPEPAAVPPLLSVPPRRKDEPKENKQDSSPSPANSASLMADKPGQISPAAEDEMVFDIHSIKSDAKVKAALPAKTDKKLPKFYQKRSFALVCIGAVVMACFAVAIVNYIHSQKPAEQDVLAPVLQQPKNIDLDWTIIKNDRDVAYLSFYKRSIERLKQNPDTEEREEIQGKVLIDVVLASIRYASLFANDFEMLDNSAKTIAQNCQSDWCALGLYSWGLFRDNAELTDLYQNKISKDREFQSIKNVIELSVQFIKWDYTNNTLAELKPNGDKILKSIGNLGLSEWPVAAWIKVTVLSRLGRWQEAYDTSHSLSNSEQKPLSVSMAMSEIDALMALDRFNDTKPLFDYLNGIKNLSENDKDLLTNRSLMMDAVSKNSEDFLKELTPFIKTNAKNPLLIQGASNVCQAALIYKDCELSFKQASDANPSNLGLKEDYINAAIQGVSIQKSADFDFDIHADDYNKISAVLTQAIADAPQHQKFWRFNVLLSFLSGKADLAVKAIDEIERGQKMVWFGAFLRLLIHWNQADDNKKSSIAYALDQYVKDVWKPFDALILAYALNTVGNSDSAQKVIEQAFEIAPADSNLLNLRFVLAVQNKNLDRAQNCIDRLMSRHANKPIHEYWLSMLYEDLGKPDVALERMLTLLAKVNDNAEFIGYVGELFFRQNQFEQALTYFNQSIEISTALPNVHYYKGRCLYQNNQFEEALSEFSEANTIDDRNQTYRLWYGMTYLKLGQSNDALKAFSEIIDSFEGISPDSRTQEDIVNAADAHFYRAVIKEHSPQRLEADDEYQKAINLIPNSPEYLQGYIVHLYENERIKDCMMRIEALESIPQIQIDARTYFIKGVSLLKLNKRSDAIAAFERALAGGYGDRDESGIDGVREPAEIYERLGYLYRDLGKRDEARNMLKLLLQKSKSLSPSAKRDIQNDIDKI